MVSACFSRRSSAPATSTSGLMAVGVDLGLTVFRRAFQAQRAGLTAKLVLADDAETRQELDSVASRQVD